MATWCEDTSHNSKKRESQDDEESWGFEGGYSSDRGRSRHSLDWENGKLRENSLGESEEEEEGDGDDSDGDYTSDHGSESLSLNIDLIYKSVCLHVCVHVRPPTNNIGGVYHYCAHVLTPVLFGYI
jgi:hypothetical protein